MPSLLSSPLARLLAGICALLVSACGFQLRGAQSLPYASMYLAVPENSELAVGLKRAIRVTGSTRLTETPAEAQAVLTPVGDSREKTVLSFNSAGRVREFQLRYRYSFRLQDPKGRDLIEPVVISMMRDFSFDDAAVLAKEQEEALLWRDMENDLVHQIMRRLATAASVAPAKL